MVARKPRQLPFVVKPRLAPLKEVIGSDESGKIEIERRGYLSVAEKSFVQGAEASDETSQMIQGLAIRIGGDLSIDPKEVLTRISSGQIHGEMAPYSDEIMVAVSRIAAFADRRKIVVATCMMMSRVDPKWEVEDTMAMHPDLLNSLELFYNEEELQTLDALEAATIEGKTKMEEPELGKGLNQGQEIPFAEYFWQLKRLFPGDPDFSVENYSSLDYGYVVLAVMRGGESRKLSLHEIERPVASLAALMANQSRDAKKKKEPYTLDQFCLYKPREAQNLPKYVYGSAAVQAIEKGLFPNWGLFCYKELAASASASYKPRNSIAVSDDAIILHPTVEEDGVRGLLIALESAGGMHRTFVDEKGQEYELAVPPIGTKVEAAENVKLFFRIR